MSDPYDAIRAHDAVRAQARELGAQKLAIQNKLSLREFSGEQGRQRLIRDAQAIEKTLAELKHKAAGLAIARQKADLTIRQSPADPFFNEAQLQHMRLLAVRARDRELKVSARLQSSLDLLAMIEPLLRGTR